jgi:hypothetical protein
MPEIRIQIEDDDADVTSKSNTEAESIEDIRRRGDEAAAEAARLRHEAAKYRAEGAHNRIVAALGRTDLEGQEAQSEYRSAVEAGDSDAQTRAQARMTEVEARRVRLLEHEQALRNALLSRPILSRQPARAGPQRRLTGCDHIRSTCAIRRSWRSCRRRTSMPRRKGSFPTRANTSITLNAVSASSIAPAMNALPDPSLLPTSTRAM